MSFIDPETCISVSRRLPASSQDGPTMAVECMNPHERALRAAPQDMLLASASMASKHSAVTVSVADKTTFFSHSGQRLV